MRRSAGDPHGVKRNTLLAICRYVCKRKEVSLASSVLILRFLHGYYPNEVSRLTHRSRSAVDGLLRAARNDLKEYLRELPPYYLSDADEPLRLSNCHDELAADVMGLRQILFMARKGQCFEREQLRTIYSDANAKLSKLQLSHLVGCPRCLDLANSLLNLVPLRERSPVDAIGKIPALLTSVVLLIKLGCLVDLTVLLQQTGDSWSDVVCFMFDWGVFWQQNVEAFTDFLT